MTVSINQLARAVALYQVDCHAGSCPICGRAAKAPFRRIVDFKIVAGCISLHHDSPDSWAARPEVQAWRAQQAAELAALYEQIPADYR